MFLSNREVKLPVAWGKLTDKRWLQLGDTVHIKLTDSGTLSQRLTLLESTIFAEAATLIGNSPPPNDKLAGQSRRTKLPINKKNLLLAQIKSSSFPEQKIARDHLHHVRSKIKSFHKAKKKAAKSIGV